MAVSYEYSMGSVRAKEKELLSDADIEAMLALKDIDSLVKYLNDNGYGDGESVDGIIKSNKYFTVKYLEELVPDPSFFDVFSYVNDAHNIKAVLKGTLAYVDFEKLILTPNTISVEDIETAVKENKYELLPEEFSESAKKAYEILAHTADARLSDAYIDLACMTAQLKKAKETKNEFLYEYVKTDIFYRNVKIALRACLTNAPKAYYDDSLLGTLEEFDKKEVTAAGLKGIDALCDYLALKDKFKCAEAIALFKDSPAAFERFSENLLTSLTREKCKLSGNGAEAALGFYLARQTEYKVIHIIAAGIETASAPEITRERLRELYG